MAILRRVAWLARWHDVAGGVGATLRERDDVVLFEFASGAAIGAGVVEAHQDGVPLIGGEGGRQSSSEGTTASLSHGFLHAAFRCSVAILDDLLVVPALFFTSSFRSTRIGRAGLLPSPFWILFAPLSHVVAVALCGVVALPVALAGRQPIFDLGWQMSPPEHRLHGEFYHGQGVR